MHKVSNPKLNLVHLSYLKLKDIQMKHLSIFIIAGFLLTAPTMINAHCGGCGVGNKKTVKSAAHAKKHHRSIDNLNLTKSQEEKYNELHSKYDKDIAKLKESFDADVMKILSADQQKSYQKKSSKSCCATK